MQALDEDRFAYPDLRKVQLIDCQYGVFRSGWVPNDRNGALRRIGTRVFQYQCTTILGAQNGRQRLSDAWQLGERHVKNPGFQAQLARHGYEGRGVRFSGIQRKAPPQLTDAR